MPFRIDGDVITLDGHCSIEEAQPLFDALRGMDVPVFDLAGAETLHTAIVQLIVACPSRVRGASDLTLAACFRDRLMS